MSRIALLAMALFLALGAGAAYADASGTNKTIYIADTKIELTQELWTIGGWTYAPVKEFADLMGWTLVHDAGSGEITLSGGLEDSLSFRAGSSEVVFNGRTYDIGGTIRAKDGITYAPLRILAESMHASVGWEPRDKVAIVRQEEAYAVAAGDTLSSIAGAHDTSVAALKARNGLTGDALQIGQRLKVVAPDFLDPDSAPKAAPAAEAAIDQAELTMLAKLVEAEAGSEPYAGKLAVASVVMNRLHNDNYPDTVKGVIYAPGQFSPAGNGSLERERPSRDSLKAAKAALSGENNVPGALFFFNPRLEPAKAKRVKAIKKIGNHLFAK
ncbi:cell wall hydrolase [Cohnella sp. 56]|uniref:cell wall hydrolase n=1 Tax=Cohnella sp. 56 TaxID=3113722 RepID=UPI0030EA2ECE